MNSINRAVRKAIKSAHQHIKQIKLPKIFACKPQVPRKEFVNPLFQQTMPKGGDNPLFGLPMVHRQNSKHEPYTSEVKLVARKAEDKRPAKFTMQELETRLDLIEGAIEEVDVPTQDEQQERDAMMKRIQAGIAQKSADIQEITSSLKGYGDKAADLRSYTPTRGLSTRRRGIAPEGEIVGGASKATLPQKVTDDLLLEKLELLSKK